jgi:hypothetical protein
MEPRGGVKHFPAGTYNDQMNAWTGRQELRLMGIVHSVWFMFRGMKMSEWGAQERRLATWLMPDPLKPPEPTHRLDDIIANLWPVSLWLYRVMWELQGRDDG